MEIKLINKLRQQLAHCLYSHGDMPEELLYKLETLVLEWYSKGVNHGIENERKDPAKSD
jgi:hypothetical protein